MYLGFILNIISICYVTVLSIIYFSKKRIRLLENKIYESMLIATILGFVINIVNLYFNINYGDEFLFRSILVKSYHACLLMLIFSFTFYIITISISKENIVKILKKIIIIPTCLLGTLLIIINFLLPLEFNNNIITGQNVTYIYLMLAIFVLIWLVYIIVNLKKIIKNKVLPILMFVILIIAVTIIQYFYPDLSLETSLISFILLFVYLTIENPDLKMSNEMTLAKEKAEKANMAKSELLLRMSHEIRTPLNAIKGYSELSIETVNIKEANDYAKEVAKSADNLLEILNSILDMSRLESGNMDMINIDYDPIELFNYICKLINVRMKEKNLDFRINISKDIPNLLHGDKVSMQKVLFNLLSNAAKYTDKGYVDFNVQCIINEDICNLIISVEDSGIGIQPEKMNQLFTKFNRLDEDRNASTEGTGLGLAMTKHLIGMMGGKITVQSVYGSGSKFTISLNQVIKNHRPNNTVIFIPDKKEYTEIPGIIDTVSSLQIIDDGKNAKMDFSGKKVLVVDDSKLNINVISKILKQYNIEIIGCISGSEAISRINNGETFDLLLVDDMMPNMRGTEMMLLLRKREYNTPIVVLTANALSGEREKYLEKGFDEYIGKPINRDELNKVLNKFLSNNNNEVNLINKFDNGIEI